MPTTTAPGVERTLTELDFARLRKLANGKAPQWLTDLLDAADILDAREMPSDIVTMYSTVEFEDVTTGQLQKLTICYPGDAEPTEGFVSVLSPVGCGLLGLRVGDVARWQTPSGEKLEARVVSVLFQPEASGDYVL